MVPTSHRHNSMRQYLWIRAAPPHQASNDHELKIKDPSFRHLIVHLPSSNRWRVSRAAEGRGCYHLQWLPYHEFRMGHLRCNARSMTRQPATGGEGNCQVGACNQNRATRSARRGPVRSSADGGGLACRCRRRRGVSMGQTCGQRRAASQATGLEEEGGAANRGSAR
jgi:hypothetical protein